MKPDASVLDVAVTARRVGELFDRYSLAIRRYLARIGLSASDVDDLVQATFLEVVRAAPRFDPRFAVQSWVNTVWTRLHHARAELRAVLGEEER